MGWTYTLKIQCVSGFFIIRDEATWEIPRFISMVGLQLVSFRDFWTFPFLVTAEDYSLKGKQYLGVTATKTFEGEPWDIMAENGLVYDFGAGLVKPISTITQHLYIKDAGQFYVSNGLLVPGSLRDDGKRVTDYSARFLWDSNSFRYSEVVCG